MTGFQGKHAPVRSDIKTERLREWTEAPENARAVTLFALARAMRERAESDAAAGELANLELTRSLPEEGPPEYEYADEEYRVGGSWSGLDHSYAEDLSRRWAA